MSLCQWKPLKLSYHCTNFGAYSFCGSRDKTFLVCHVTSHDQRFKALFDVRYHITSLTSFSHKICLPLEIIDSHLRYIFCETNVVGKEMEIKLQKTCKEKLRNSYETFWAKKMLLDLTVDQS